MSSYPKVIVKILIDQDEYQRLQDCETQLKEYHQKEKKNLELISTEHSENQQTNKLNEQIGKGEEQLNSNALLTKDVIQQIVNVVKLEIVKELNLNNTNVNFPPTETKFNNQQVGHGNEDLLRPTVKLSSLDLSPEPGGNLTETTNSQHDIYDAHNVLKMIPKIYYNKAKLLLNWIENNPSEVTFSNDGSLIIDSINIPNSNIKIIIPALFQKRKSFVPGLTELATKLSLMNQGHLIKKGILKTLKRPNNYKLSFLESTFDSKKKHWWYLGE